MTEAEHQQFPGDYEAQVGQGAVTVHSEEHFGQSDRGIVMVRRMLGEQLEALAEGRDPIGVSLIQRRRRSNSKRGISFARRDGARRARNKIVGGRTWSTSRRRLSPNPRPPAKPSAYALLRAGAAHHRLCAELPRSHHLQRPDRADQKGISAQRHHDGPARRLWLRAVLLDLRHSDRAHRRPRQPPQHRRGRLCVLERDDVLLRHGAERHHDDASAHRRRHRRIRRHARLAVDRRRSLQQERTARVRSASTPSARIWASSSAISSAATSTSTTAGGRRSSPRVCPALRSQPCCG